MANYSYTAVDPRGDEARGVLDVADQAEAVRRVREMGLFPTKIKMAREKQRGRAVALNPAMAAEGRRSRSGFSLGGRIRAAKVVVFTRQLATMIGAGLSLIRSLRILEEQEETRSFKRAIGDLSSAIENGSSFSEALAAYPRVFNPLYLSLVRAGEVGGALEITLGRLADFMEKAHKLRGKLKAAMFYPSAVILVAAGVMGMLMAFVVPSFQWVFEGLLEGAPLPVFTRFIFALSNTLVHRLPSVILGLGLVGGFFAVGLRTHFGQRWFDQAKLAMPVLGPLFRKAAISRFARTLGTLAGNGVPILQSLLIVKETTGNLIVSEVIARVHEQVKQGDTIAPCLRSSRVFPAMVAGMVDVGEQTGALPEMLMTVADNYDEEFDNAAKGLTSLLEPILIVFLAIVVGSIVVAMFLPLISIVTTFDGRPDGPN
jgi:type IV pilus assembly protein PilC